MDLSIGAKTDAGKRENNEDAVLVIRPRNNEIGADAVIIVADGMGGRASGEDASRVAVTTIQSTLDQLLKAGPKMPPYADALTAAIRRANSEVYELAHSRPGRKGMGTTCVAAIIADDSATIAHVGDSRAYLLRDGLLRRLTDDHSYVHDQVKSGNLSDHDARTSRFRHVITKAIGIDATVVPDIRTHKLIEGDSLLVCTDGLSNIVDEAGMIQIMSRARTAQEAIENLVDAAKRAGSRDNITGALARIGVVDTVTEPSSARREVAHGSINPEPPPIEPKPEALEVRAPVSGQSLRMAAGTAGGAIIGALLITLLYVSAGWLRVHSAAHTPSTAGSVKAPASIAGVTYAQPQILMYQNVMPGLVAGSDAGVIVADSKTGKLLSVDQAGQVRPAGQIDTEPAGSIAPLYLATDDRGYIYIADPSARSLKRYAPDGRFDQAIAQGRLDEPHSLYVARSGDIYIVDGNRLKLIRALPNLARH